MPGRFIAFRDNYGLMRITALFLAVLILLLVVPVHAIEINPSVDTIPFFCKYTLTDWTPLCVRSTTQSIIIEGEMNQTFNLTPNMTSGSDFQSSGFLFLNGSRPMEGNLNMSAYNITVNNITGNSDVVNKSYVDALSAYQMNVIKNQSEQIDSLTKRIEDLEKKT